jgi:hypothetical protein
MGNRKWGTMPKSMQPPALLDSPNCNEQVGAVGNQKVDLHGNPWLLPRAKRESIKWGSAASPSTNLFFNPNTIFAMSGKAQSGACVGLPTLLCT